MRPSTLSEESPGGNPGKVALRPPIATFAIFTSTPRTLADVLADPELSDRAKRVAQYLDGCCKAWARWLAWPFVATIAEDLGWDAEHGGRKRVERAFQELGQSGDLVRLNIRQLWEWIDREGPSSGVAIPSRIPRHLKQNRKLCVLGWKVREASQELPKPPRCDTSVASKPTSEPNCMQPTVALNGTVVSHDNGTEVSHSSLNVRNLNERSERTSDGLACADSGKELSTMGVATDSTADAPASRRVAAYQLVRRFRKDFDVRFRFDASGQLLMPQGPNYPAPSQADEDRLRDLLPEVLEELASLGIKAPKPTRLAAESPVVALIESLPESDGARADHEAGRAIAAAIGDTKEDSIKTFTGYARDVRRGFLPSETLVKAFLAASSKGARNPGSLLVSRIKLWKESNPDWSVGRECFRT